MMTVVTGGSSLTKCVALDTWALCNFQKRENVKEGLIRGICEFLGLFSSKKKEDYTGNMTQRWKTLRGRVVKTSSPSLG